MVDEAGNVHRLTATTLVIPEEKRCVAMTVRGERCKAGRMKALQVCIFHSHLALDNATLGRIADGQAPRLSPRKALQAVVNLRSEELATAAVAGALSSENQNATKAVLSLLDAVDPLVATEERVEFTPEGASTASWRTLSAAFGA